MTSHLTPDRFPGPLEEAEEIQLSDAGTDPTVAGAIRYVSGAFRLKDGTAVFDPRTYVHTHASSHAKDAADEVLVQDLGTGELASGKTFQSDGSGGVAYVDVVPGFPPNRESAGYTTPYSTSSATYQQVWRYATQTLPTGTYFFAVMAWLDTTNAGNITDAQVQVDDMTSIAKWIAPVGFVGGIVPLVGVYTIVFSSAATHNIDFDIRKASGNGNVIMSECYVTLWRVS